MFHVEQKLINFFGMKPIRNILLSFLAVLLTACNPDVFIKEFLAEDLEILVKDGKASVHFKADNWGILGIMKGSSISSVGVYATVCDLEGKQIKSLPLEEGELAVLTVDTETIDFRVEKRDLRRLDLICGENLEDGPERYVLEVGNDYEHKMISFTFPSSRKYQIDSVVYQWKDFFWSDNTLELVRSFVIDNTASSEPVSWLFYPYEEVSRKFECYFDAGWNSDRFKKIFGRTKSEITVPDVEGGRPVLRQTRIGFGQETQRLDAGLDNKHEVEVTIQPGEKRQVDAYLCLEVYSVPFKVYASSPETRRKRVFSAMLHSARPFDYLILKKRLDDENADS